MRIPIKKTPAYSKFSVDSFYNFISLGLLAVCGLLINFVIARKYGASTLGVFNQTYAIYLVVTQLASMGVQLSVLKYVTQSVSEEKPLDDVISSALMVVMASTTFFSLAVFFLRWPLAGLLDSSDIAPSLVFVIPGLWCLSLNKIFLSVFNALREMKIFAALSALRYAVMLVTLLVLSALNVPGKMLSIVFSTAEIVLLLPCLFLCRDKFRFRFVPLENWFRRHLTFGLKSIPGGMIAVLNTRVDVLMLGYFLPDKQVGQYSLAAMIVEGVLQLPFVFRRNLDPIITRLYTLGQYDRLQAVIRRIRRTTFIGMALIGAALMALLPGVISFFIGDDSFTESYRIFVVLMAGAIVAGTYLPASGILVQTGFPGHQTMWFLLCFATNVILNLGLIRLWGAMGAAVATAITFGLGVIYLKWYARKYVSIRL